MTPRSRHFCICWGCPPADAEELEARRAYETVSEVLEHLPDYKKNLDLRVRELEAQAEKTPVLLEDMLRQCGLLEPAAEES